jgi:hypothetical protein
MIGLIVELAVTPDSGAAFERAFAVQAAAVQANEPRNRCTNCSSRPLCLTATRSLKSTRMMPRFRRIAAHGGQSTADRDLSGRPPVMQAFEVIAHRL